MSSKFHEAGKGSKQRPTDNSKFSEGWDRIFKNEYQDILSTEDCVISALEALEKEEKKSLTDDKK